MEGLNSNFPGGNGTNMLQQMTNFNNVQNISNVLVQPPNSSNINNNNNATSELNPKRQPGFDRLKKRMNLYRKRQNESVPRFEQTFSGICEQQSIETNVLQKRFIESKAKRVAKKADKKQTDVAQGLVVTQTKNQIKRPALDELENEGDVLPPAAKVASTGMNSIDNMKFQVEIVQQLEFTTSVANLQPQQISTNVTVKAMTNGNVKYEPQENKVQKHESGKVSSSSLPLSTSDILQDFKQEPDNEFADLDFGGLANFMANDESELKKLFSNISEVFDQDLFDQDKIKQEPISNIPQQNASQINHLNQQFNQYVMPESCHMQKPMVHQLPQTHRMYQPQQVQQPQQQHQQQLPEMSPAAQTLKNMAQQHQVKNSIAMNNIHRPLGQPLAQQINQQHQQQQQPNMNQRLLYQQQHQSRHQQHPQFNDLNPQFHKNHMHMTFPPEIIKQEMLIQNQQPSQIPSHQMKPQINHQMMMHQNGEIKLNQQYQQYQNTQFITNHQTQPQQRNAFNSNQQSTMNIHMKQSQMMHIQPTVNTGGNINNIHMQGGQHMHFAGDMKIADNTNFSMQQQQSMYFNHHNHQQPYGNVQTMQKRPQQHQAMGAGEVATNTYNMMQSQSMTFTP
ncbi:CLUMA_CG020959, isoform A [Clunio marinus]|uniref:CLUMA_CG020959, isoform A n=1 Tax=Clunio marinus TaxID=568069 RepID=A0A1J1J897_9DIPT|nr:CLUMA_CG020959, isoform A [Clunio marinus]